MPCRINSTRLIFLFMRRATLFPRQVACTPISDRFRSYYTERTPFRKGGKTTNNKNHISPILYVIITITAGRERERERLFFLYNSRRTLELCGNSPPITIFGCLFSVLMTGQFLMQFFFPCAFNDPESKSLGVPTLLICVKNTRFFFQIDFYFVLNNNLLLFFVFVFLLSAGSRTTIYKEFRDTQKNKTELAVILLSKVSGLFYFRHGALLIEFEHFSTQFL